MSLHIKPLSLIFLWFTISCWSFDFHRLGNHMSWSTSNASFFARERRALLNLFSDQQNSNYQTGNESPIMFGATESSPFGTMKKETPSQALRHSSERILGGVTDLVMAPFEWLAHIQLYWPFYLIIITIMLILITYVYCSCHRHVPIDYMINNQSRTMMAAMMNLLRLQRPTREQIITT